MRLPKSLGFAVGFFAIIAAEHAFSGSDHAPRFTDPDLIALEKVTTRAKRAMDAFVLRPRVPDAYDSVCVGCSQQEGIASALRVARSVVDRSHDVETTSALDTHLRTRRRDVTLPPIRHAGRAAPPRQRVAREARRLRRAFDPRIAAVSWEAELRR